MKYPRLAIKKLEGEVGDAFRDFSRLNKDLGTIRERDAKTLMGDMRDGMQKR